MTYVVAEPCIGVKDHACVDVCPVSCFYEAEEMLVINPDECIDCGACQPECPAEAIFAEEDVPERWRSYIEKGRMAFETHPDLKAAQDRSEWEADKEKAGTIAHEYYQKFKPLG